ncbi:citrate synthase-like protein [Xylariaceae sp. AK1471]|nr:citrate synthase-like protein [Xylariaceae sp. AK1471]
MAPTVSLVYCHKRDHEFTESNPQGSFISNILKMTCKSDKKAEKCLERLWILYTDHEMTNSTAAFLHASSILTNPISSSIAAMVSAYGPLYGGVVDIAHIRLQKIGSADIVPRFIQTVKDGKQRLYGYGYRIYKMVGLRAKFIHQMIHEQLKKSLMNLSHF